MNYQVLARRFRPNKFCDVIGQEAVLTTLSHALKQGRVAQAYLFCGARGTGKTTLARLLAKALNCSALTEEGEPCNACPSCLDITASRAMDVLEIDGASHRGIEDIRQINEAVHFTSTLGKYKIYLIDEVHMLTKEAFNALLKTLEEPPPHVKFFFATTEVHKVPATILSRCQRFYLRRLTEEQIVMSLQRIAEVIDVTLAEPEGLRSIARLAEGSLRDAQSLFDQVMAFCNGVLSVEGVQAALGLPDHAWFVRLDESRGRYEVAFEVAQELFASGKSVAYFFEGLAHHLRTHLLSKRGIGLSPGAEHYREEQLLELVEMMHEAMQGIKNSPSEQVYLEMALLRLVRSHERISPLELVRRLEALEQRLPEELSKNVSEGLFKQVVVIPTVPEPKKTASVAPVSVVPAPKKCEPVSTAPVLTEPTSKKSTPVTAPVTLTRQEQSRVETLMRFAAKELNGSVKLKDI